ncbi:MAG: helix-turn-helix transcriptional regulator [Oscillospiraceae bacterium]|nr:helix-turn-helix transcriptional regulator [Oscillospiraceae bacterium]
MTLQLLLDQKNITKYHLSKISGVPKTTIIDICAGKSSIDRCSAKTVFQIAKALGCSMEDIMMLEEPKRYDSKTGLPEDEAYLECALPKYLQISLENMKASWEKEDRGEKDYHWDLYWGELNADINSAEVERTISSEQAWYLRKKYLRM